MRFSKIITVLLCVPLMTCGALLLTGCGSDKKTEESSKGTESSVPDDVTQDSFEEGDPSETSAQQDSSESDTFTDEELKAMEITDEKLGELTNTDEFKNGDLETRKKLAEDTLNELAKDGYVIKDSMYVSDDMISFSYKGGALGGIQLKGFDPYMNGTKN